MVVRIGVSITTYTQVRAFPPILNKTGRTVWELFFSVTAKICRKLSENITQTQFSRQNHWPSFNWIFFLLILIPTLPIILCLRGILCRVDARTPAPGHAWHVAQLPRKPNFRHGHFFASSDNFYHHRFTPLMSCHPLGKLPREIKLYPLFVF